MEGPLTPAAWGMAVLKVDSPVMRQDELAAAVPVVLPGKQQK